MRVERRTQEERAEVEVSQLNSLWIFNTQLFRQNEPCLFGRLTKSDEVWYSKSTLRERKANAGEGDDAKHQSTCQSVKKKKRISWRKYV